MLFMMMCVKLGSFTLFKLEVKVRVNVKNYHDEEYNLECRCWQLHPVQSESLVPLVWLERHKADLKRIIRKVLR